jgi:ammonium transporter, Amt family
MAGGSEINGGWVDCHYMQFLYQLLSVVVCAAWSFVWTFIILKAIDYMPFMRLRLNEWEEIA